MRTTKQILTGAVCALLSVAVQGSVAMADDLAPSPSSAEPTVTQTSYGLVPLRGRRVYCPPVAPNYCPPAPTPPVSAEGTPTVPSPSPSEPDTTNAANTAPNTDLNAIVNNPNANTNPLSNPQPTANSRGVPGMIGDFFGGATINTSTSNATVYKIDAFGNVLNPIYSGGHFVGYSTNMSNTLTLDPIITTGPFGHQLVSDSVHGHGMNLVTAGTATVDGIGGVAVFNVTSPANTGGMDPSLTTGRTKLTEGASPIPRDRVFFNYSYFGGTQLTSSGIAVNRYTPGFEKTFFNGNASFEVRMPFASTLGSNIDQTTGVVNPTDLQFGNLTTYSKALLYQDQTFALSIGSGMSLPTANNINIYTGPTQTLHISNDSVHILPYIGGVYTPSDRLYTQGILQFDTDLNGNRVDSSVNAQGIPFAGSNGLQNGLQKVGTFRDSTYLYASISTGYWVYRSSTPTFAGITGFSPIGELHYNRSLSPGNVIGGAFDPATANIVTNIYGQPYSNNEILNGVVGGNVLFGSNKILTTGYTFPLGMGVDKQFAGEFRMMFNWYFGGGYNSSTLTRSGRAVF